MMKYTKFFGLSLLAGVLSLLTACSGSDELSAPQPEKKVWKVSMEATGESITEEDDGAGSNRAIFYGGNSGKRFSFIWDDGDVVQVYKGDEWIGQLEPNVLGQESTTLVGTLYSEISAGDELTVYLGDQCLSYVNQLGTLSDLSTYYSFQQATVTVKAENINGSTLSLPVTKLTHMQSYWRLRLLDEEGNRLHPTQVSVYATSGKMVRTKNPGSPTEYYDEYEPMVITPAPENGEYPDELFFAMNNENPVADTYMIYATVDGAQYAGPIDKPLTYLFTKGRLSSVVRQVKCTYDLPSNTGLPATAHGVDLGLPSGLKWANLNIGAHYETDYGTYFAWGETSGYTVVGHTADPVYNNPKTYFSLDTYAWCKGANNTLTKYCPSDKQSTAWWCPSGSPVPADNKTQLELGDDAAHANWGGSWRTPTLVEYEELIANTDNEWVTDYEGSGVNGVKFMKKDDHTVFIFMPATGLFNGPPFYYQNTKGRYVSSTVYSPNPSWEWVLTFSDGSVSMDSGSRPCGYTVRAVK